jgi:hypothetical protein
VENLAPGNEQQCLAHQYPHPFIRVRREANLHWFGHFSGARNPSAAHEVNEPEAVATLVAWFDFRPVVLTSDGWQAVGRDHRGIDERAAAFQETKRGGLENATLCHAALPDSIPALRSSALVSGWSQASIGISACFSKESA